MATHNILVIGATGRTGSEAVKQGLARGHKVTAFVRDPARAQGLLPSGARIVKGDALDAKSVAAAMPGHDAVLVAVGDARTFVSAETTRNAVAAMKASGVRRIVLLSAYGIGDSAHGIHGFLMTRVLSKLNADKTGAEAVLEQSGLDWTAVRPPVLSLAPAKGAQAAVGAKINGFGSLGRADLAAFILDEIDTPKFVGKKPIVWSA